MSEIDAVADLLGGGRSISYKTDLAHMTGSVTAGLLLSQFWYWTNILAPRPRGMVLQNGGGDAVRNRHGAHGGRRRTQETA